MALSANSSPRRFSISRRRALNMTALYIPAMTELTMDTIFCEGGEDRHASQDDYDDDDGLFAKSSPCGRAGNVGRSGRFLQETV